MAAYLTVEEAQEIADERLNVDSWEDAKDEDGSEWGETGTYCVKALAQATKIIDTLNYRGEKTSSSQTLAFPRGGDTEVPNDIKLACFEIALALLNDVDPDIEAENLNLVSQGYANIRATYDRNSANPNVIAGVPSMTAWKYLVPYLKDPMAVTILRS